MADLKQCPYLDKPCIQEKCNLYITVPIMAPGQLVGSVRMGSLTGCVFNINANLLANIAAMMQGPPPAPPIKRN